MSDDLEHGEFFVNEMGLLSYAIKDPHTGLMSSKRSEWYVGTIYFDGVRHLLCAKEDNRPGQFPAVGVGSEIFAWYPWPE